jgi:hypothetical protein
MPLRVAFETTGIGALGSVLRIMDAICPPVHEAGEQARAAPHFRVAFLKMH